MQIYVKLIVFLMLFYSSLNASSIKAMQVLGNVSDIGPTSKAWLSASYQEIILYPKYTGSADNQAIRAKVKAIHDGQNISFLIKWKGNDRGVENKEGSMVYVDGFIIQFPVNFTDANKLPYIDKGNKGRPVVAYLQKKIKTTYEAYESIDLFLRESELQKSPEKIVIEEIEEHQEELIYEGKDYKSTVLSADQSFKMYMVYKNGYWRGTLSLPLYLDYLDLDKGVFPVSFALLDKNASKLMSPWIAVKLVSKSGGDSLLKALSEQPEGNITNGERMASENCASCHQYGDTGIGSDFIAPNLSNIGGYSIKEYLRESILYPNAVVVSGNENSSWYDTIDKDTKVSTMPSFGWLDKDSLNDLIAFFMRQKAEE